MTGIHRILLASAILVVAVPGCGQQSAGPPGSGGSIPTAAGTVSSSAAASVESSADASASTAAVAPQEPVEFTGRISCGPAVRSGSEETLDVGDGGMVVTQSRGGAWQQPITMSDPRLEGTVHHTFEADTYRAKGTAKEGPELWAATRRIVNAEGAWVDAGYGGIYADGKPIGGNSPTVYVGELGYEGMVAIMEETPIEGTCDVSVRGVIFTGVPVPVPYIPN